MKSGVYAERAFFHSSEGNSRFARSFRYFSACFAAISLPSSMLSTVSDGAIQVFVLTLYTDACTPIALSSENNRKCSLPTFTSAHCPLSSILKLCHLAGIYASPNESRSGEEVNRASRPARTAAPRSHGRIQER